MYVKYNCVCLCKLNEWTPSVSKAKPATSDDKFYSDSGEEDEEEEGSDSSYEDSSEGCVCVSVWKAWGKSFKNGLLFNCNPCVCVCVCIESNSNTESEENGESSSESDESSSQSEKSSDLGSDRKKRKTQKNKELQQGTKPSKQRYQSFLLLFITVYGCFRCTSKFSFQ